MLILEKFSSSTNQINLRRKIGLRQKGHSIHKMLCSVITITTVSTTEHGQASEKTNIVFR